jgi:hypothetical protein
MTVLGVTEMIALGAVDERESGPDVTVAVTV